MRRSDPADGGGPLTAPRGDAADGAAARGAAPSRGARGAAPSRAARGAVPSRAARGAWPPGTAAPRARAGRKATHAAECRALEQLPNIGASMAADLRALGIAQPGDLTGCDPLDLYHRLCRASGTRQDPCVLDTFMAVVDFMRGAPARPWWHYTAERKRLHPRL